MLWVHHSHLVYLSDNVEGCAASRGNEVTLQEERYISGVYHCAAGEVSGLFKGTDLTTVGKSLKTIKRREVFVIFHLKALFSLIF
jgi:hypothetical protein